MNHTHTENMACYLELTSVIESLLSIIEEGNSDEDSENRLGTNLEKNAEDSWKDFYHLEEKRQLLMRQLMDMNKKEALSTKKLSDGNNSPTEKTLINSTITALTQLIELNDKLEEKMITEKQKIKQALLVSRKSHKAKNSYII